MTVRARARMALIDAVCRIVTGKGLERAEKPDVEERLRLFGFRKTAREFLLRRLARAAVRDGGLVLFTPALEGLFTLAVPGDDLGVGSEILESGTYEPHIVSFYRRRLRPDMTVVDVGANIGFHALHAAARVGPGGRVIAVEPDPGNATLLRLSLQLAAEAPPVEVIEAGLSDSDGELILSDLGNAANSGARFTHPDRSHLEAHVHGSNPRFQTIPGFRWDGRFGERRIDLVKLDIEGFEPRAIAGMEGSLARHRPVVVSEFAPSNLADIGGVDPRDYLRWFQERGYRCSLSNEDGELVHRTPEELIEHAGRQHHVDLAFEPE